MKVDLTKIDTEKRNLNSMNLDEMSAAEIVKLINEEDNKIQVAIGKELESISKLVQEAANTIKNKGRIIYVGAGTSGRLGVLDAVECPPTYGVDYNTVVGLIAGGEKAFVKAQEGAEDSKEYAKEDLMQIQLTSKDIVIGIAASGRTPYVIGALEYAKEVGAQRASIAITKNSEIAKYANFVIEVVVGPEVVTGSTRMKAGTAQKMILNMISTGAMILNGKVYQNLMVDVMQTNEKLVERAKNIVKTATDCTDEQAINALEQAQGSAKVAIVMILLNIDVDLAKEKLAENEETIAKVLKN